MALLFLLVLLKGMLKTYLEILYITSWIIAIVSFAVVYSRAEASCSKLAELNPYVEVKVFTKPLEENLDFLKEFQVMRSRFLGKEDK